MDKAPKQTALPFRSWGGKRRNAGRKPKSGRPGVSHGPRPALTGRQHPVHTVLRMRAGCWNLRSHRALSVLRPALGAASGKPGFRVVHYSVQGNHLHLIVEADDKQALSRGMQGLAIRAARALNHLMRRSGRVLADHYYAHILKTPREVARALAYVRENYRHHASQFGETLAPGYRDPYATQVALVAPRTWLLAVGWQRAAPG